MSEATDILQIEPPEQPKRGQRKVWFQMRITSRQLSHLEMLCNFHLAESCNEFAKADTARLLTCLQRWPHKIAT